MWAMPMWERNDFGSAFVQNLGHIKMKAPDWKRWFDGCFQTCLWLGTATPSKKSQAKATPLAVRLRLRQKDWQSLSKGATKGKGKGKGNG
jgi:hypothetical protein